MDINTCPSFKTYLDNNIQKLSECLIQLNVFLIHQKVASNVIYKVLLVAEEVLINIIQHGHKENQKHSIQLEVNVDTEHVRLRVRDEGAFFDITQHAVDKGKVLTESQLNGWGILLIKSLVKEIGYVRQEGLYNCLELSIENASF